MFTLTAPGVGAASGFSVLATLFPHVVPMAFPMNGEVPVCYEPATVIVVLVLLGQLLELRTRGRTSAAIRGRLRLASDTARRVGTGPAVTLPFATDQELSAARWLLLCVGIPVLDERDRRGGLVQHRVDQEATVTRHVVLRPVRLSLPPD